MFEMTNYRYMLIRGGNHLKEPEKCKYPQGGRQERALIKLSWSDFYQERKCRLRAQEMLPDTQ